MILDFGYLISDFILFFIQDRGAFLTPKSAIANPQSKIEVSLPITQ